MGGTSSKTNAVDATNQVTQEVYNNIKSTLNVEAQIDTRVTQLIKANMPIAPGCNTTAINSNITSGTLMQTASLDTLNSLSAGLNSKFDSDINQLNQDGADALIGLFGKNQKDNNNITTINNIKNEVHNSICNAVSAISVLNTTVNQEIDYNQNDPKYSGTQGTSRFPINFSCGNTFLENINNSKAQICQAACSIVQNISDISTISEDTLKAAQTNTGFLGDLVSGITGLITKIMYAVIVVAIVGFILAAVGFIIYFTTRPSHPKSSDSLLDGIPDSLDNV